MANRDYVRKSAPKTNKKPPQRAPKKKKTASSFPWVAVIVLCLLLSGLIALISMLNADPEPEPPVTEKPTVVSSTENTQTTLPPPPEEKWDYMQSLPQREVEVKAKEIVVPKIPYIMQCGAYKALSQANARKANIAMQGLRSKVVRLKGSDWHRIILGPYKFKRDAVKDLHVLQKAKIEPCIIMKDTLK